MRKWVFEILNFWDIEFLRYWYFELFRCWNIDKGWSLKNLTKCSAWKNHTKSVENGNKNADIFFLCPWGKLARFSSGSSAGWLIDLLVYLSIGQLIEFWRNALRKTKVEKGGQNPYINKCTQVVYRYRVAPQLKIGPWPFHYVPVRICFKLTTWSDTGS